MITKELNISIASGKSTEKTITIEYVFDTLKLRKKDLKIVAQEMLDSSVDGVTQCLESAVLIEQELVDATEVKPIKRENLYAVDKKQWKKWSNDARYIFNTVYFEMKSNQNLFTHPKQEPIHSEYWNTTCWNAAWIAADNLLR